MTLTNGQILMLAEGLYKLLEDNYSFAPAVSFKLAQNIKNIQSKVETIEKVRNDYFMKHGELKQNEDGTSYYKFEKDIVPVVEKEINSMLEIKSEVTLYPLKLEDFGDKEIPLDTMMKIDKIIEGSI